MSISVKNVSKLYGSQKALNNVSFEIKSGEIVGFLGPNGAGKSTMMKIITGYIPANSGEVLVNDIEIDADATEIRNKIGYLPEHNPLYLEMFVREYLLFVAGMYHVSSASKKVEDMINLTGLSKESNKKIGQLSKGYRQRVGIAQALIHDPEVLILDEPTSGLDPNQIIEIRELIAKVGKEKTVMLSTHIMQEVEAICDRVIIINNGEIVASENTKEASKMLQKQDFVIQLEVDTILQSSLFEKQFKLTENKQVNEFTWLFKTENDIRPELFELAVKEGFKVLSLQKIEKSLEQIFQELTKNK
ncbi:MAG: gliding motility-associated ABC transporter ATP-binding subunit GldA [Bacteroidales bacterium]|nr:gliding motility-associated ABC transporter ATP-binding subunit GldA [Bacteroidales bacterium]